VPIDADHEFTGSLLSLLNPYGLLGGLTTLLLFFTHGLYFVALKTDGQVHDDARMLARRAGFVTVIVAAAFLIWTIFIAAGHGAPAMVWVIAVAAVAAVCLVMSLVFNMRDREGWAFGFGAATIVAAVLTLWFALFPNVMVSSTNAEFSLTIDNASSTDYTLTIMSWAALIFLPLVLLYQGWTYWIFRKRVSRTRIERAAASVAH
jgi:cytochrome d ubiquinol oxidase subunit II